MTPNDYQEAALKTAGAADAMTPDRAIYTALGLAGEAGEVANLTKKWQYSIHMIERSFLMNWAIVFGTFLLTLILMAIPWKK